MSKEYPKDRKLQNSEDQDRMSRILKRRAEEVDSMKKMETPSESDGPSPESHSKARAE